MCKKEGGRVIVRIGAKSYFVDLLNPVHPNKKQGMGFKYNLYRTPTSSKVWRQMTAQNVINLVPPGTIVLSYPSSDM